MNNLPVRLLLCLLLLPVFSGCTAVMVTGAVVSTAVGVAVEVIEVPFEVAGAVYDVVTDDDDDDDEEEKDRDKNEDEGD